MGHDHGHVDLGRCTSQARAVLTEQFQLSHATLHVRTARNHECEEMTW